MPAERNPGGFGSKLREARERRGITLRQIANATKISISALEALERNEISRLPGGIFSRAFVRSYAIEVGLDPEETIQDFIAQFPHDSVTAGHSTSAQIEDNEALESDRRIASTVLRLLAVSLPIAGLVLYLVTAGRGEPNSPPPAGAEATVGSAGAAPDAPPVRSDGTPPAVTLPAQEPQPAPPAVEPSAVGDRLAVAVSLTGRSWVSAIVDGQRVIAREMVAGERQVVEAKRDVVLSVGDAGAVAILINGAPGRPLGKPGQVVTVQMNLTNFKQFLAAQ